MSIISFHFVQCSYFNVKNPSWSEICNFMKFLSFQLDAMEETCKGFGIASGLKEAIEEACVVPGLKEFSIRMTIKMSKVCVVCILQYKYFEFIPSSVLSQEHQQVVYMYVCMYVSVLWAI